MKEQKKQNIETYQNDENEIDLMNLLYTLWKKKLFIFFFYANFDNCSWRIFLFLYTKSL